MEFIKLGGGIYKQVFGNVFISMMDKLDIKISPKKDFSDVELPIDNVLVEQIGNKTVLSWNTPENERFYGLGLQYFKLNHRGRTRVLRINSDVRTDIGESNSCCAFFVSSKGYGVLIDTASVVEVYLASTAKKSSKSVLGEKDNNTDPKFTYTPPSDLVQVVFPSSGANVYIIAGTDKLDVVKKYNRICGGFMPEKNGLGFWHRVGRLYTDNDVLNEVEEFKKRDFPLSVIGLEPGWQTNAYPCSLVWSDKFKNPSNMLKTLKDLGITVNNWQHFYISEKSPIYKDVESRSADFTVWGGLVPDLWDNETTDILKRLIKTEQVDKGVVGLKIDECDGSEHTKFSWIYPAHARFPSGVNGEEFRQTFGLLAQKLTKEIYEEKGERTFGLVRASGLGATSMPYALYTDLYEHDEFINAMLGASYSGMLFCPEVRGVESGEELVCRFKTALFSPLMMLNAWCDAILPWSFAEVEEIIKKIMHFRYKLIPYLYSLYYEYYSTGKPVILPMNILPDFDTDEVGKRYKQFVNFKKVHVWDVFEDELTDQYMLGDRILVVVTKAGEKQKPVYLPKGEWVDFNTNKVYKGDCFINYDIEIESLPIFIKNDSILPLLENGKIVAYVYGNGNLSFELYEDDGKTYRYREGIFRKSLLSIKNGKPEISVTGEYQEDEKEIVWQKI